MQYKAIIFDLDGTLLDTIKDIANSMNSILYAAGFPIHEVLDYKLLVGEGLAKLVERALPANTRTPDLIQKYLELLKAKYAINWQQNTQPYPEIAKLLTSLVQLKIKLAVFSNKAHEFTCTMVKQLLPAWQFEVILGHQPNAPLKPDPYGALAIANCLNIQPQQFLYLGDSGIDMLTANRAGMYPVGALWGFRKADELTNSGAKLLIKHPLELLSILN